ncbi:MAG: DUF2071 domain-containing protein [Caldilineaceae bacterium]|nr:DUF2071 domain-containing protein [Caldilineaceae bacterium]
MHPSLRTIDHRPWPLPPGAWSWRQSWCDLLFAHWPAPAAQLRALVPEPLQIQEFDGTSWVGVVPFRMQGVMRRPLPDLPWVSAFPELNVRLYVEYDGKPGVWFLSLDATNVLAVWAARLLFHLPYHRARIAIEPQRNRFTYTSARSHGGPRLRAEYGPTSPVYHASPGTLEHWLTERYCLYAQAPDGALWRTEVHHAPWPLQQATATIAENSMLAPHGVHVAGPPALLHFARQIDVVVWSPRRVS